MHSAIEHNRRHGTPLISKKLWESVIRIMEYEGKNAERNVNNVTTDNLFQSPVTINS